MKIVIIDGQGGRMGKLLVEGLRAALPTAELYAVGTNSTATAVMLKAGADHGATGENPVVVACRDADVVTGPIGIIAADALLGEVTPAMAAAVGSCAAQKVLLPVNRCSILVAGAAEVAVGEAVTCAVGEIVRCVGAPPRDPA